MKIEHKTTIILETEDERIFLQNALLIARDRLANSMRANEISSDLGRSCINTVHEAGAAYRFVERLREGI